MRRLIIADVKSHNNNGKCTGHYFSVAQNYLDLFRGICDIKVAGGPIYNGRFASSDLFGLPYSSIDGENILKNKWRVMQNCRHLFRNTNKEDVIVMQQSGSATMFFFIALFARKKNNIYVIEYGTESRDGFIKNCLFNWAKKKIKGFICPNERIGKCYELPYCIVTDYIYTGKLQISDIPKYPEKKYDFAMVGSIWPDKGVVEAVERLSSTQYKILVAGNPAIENLGVRLKELAKQNSNIELHLGYVSEEDYYKYIRSSRYCILNYSGCYSDRSSGVVLDVLFNGVPIIGHRCNAFRFIEDKNMGMLVDDMKVFNPDEVINEKTYNKYMDGLCQYLKKQSLYKKKLVDFLKLQEA